MWKIDFKTIDFFFSFSFVNQSIDDEILIEKINKFRIAGAIESKRYGDRVKIGFHLHQKYN